jgi:hypothetical protein
MLATGKVESRLIWEYGGAGSSLGDVYRVLAPNKSATPITARTRAGKIFFQSGRLP